MTSRDFCFWLQGFFELNGTATMTPEQADTVRRHLALVFKHEIDPSMGPPGHQAELNQIHQPATTAVAPPHFRPGADGIVLRC
jgi:hypothetical protein